MSKANACPECGKVHSINAQRCTCGWHKPKNEESTKADYRCSFSILGRRCPLPGTLTSGLGKAGWWYCRRHYRTIGSPHSGEEELHYIEENQQKIIIEEYSDWREEFHKSKS